MITLGVDYGDARTGLAVSDPSGFLAGPAGVIHETDDAEIVRKTAQAARARGAARVVVGLPRNMNGTYGPRAEKARAFAAALEKELGLPVALFDERRTTITAATYMNETGTHGRRRKAVIDTAAATIILQDFLDAERARAARDAQHEQTNEQTEED